MSEQLWEYCELTWDGQAPTKERGAHYYNVWVRYISADKCTEYVLAEIPEKRKAAESYGVSPFYSALGLLGAVGWELVYYQAPSGWSDYYRSMQLTWPTRMAVLKRPVREGRPIDDADLLEHIKPSSG